LLSSCSNNSDAEDILIDQSEKSSREFLLSPLNKTEVNSSDFISRDELLSLESKDEYNETVYDMSPQNMQTIWIEKLDFMLGIYPEEMHSFLHDVKSFVADYNYGFDPSQETLTQLEAEMAQFQLEHSLDSEEMFYMFEKVYNIYPPTFQPDGSFEYTTTTNG
jgi:hypothetical protein